MRLQSTYRIGDTRGFGNRGFGNCGFGMIELLVTIAILAVLLAAGLPSIDQRRNAIDVTVRQIKADFRWARSRAIVRGDHFQFHKTGDHTYQIEHLQEVAGLWQVAAVTRQAVLPDHIEISTTNDKTELDSRGIVVFGDPADAVPQTWTISDSMYGAVRTLTLYPSGQLHAND